MLKMLHFKMLRITQCFTKLEAQRLPMMLILRTLIYSPPLGEVHGVHFLSQWSFVRRLFLEGGLEQMLQMDCEVCLTRYEQATLPLYPHPELQFQTVWPDYLQSCNAISIFRPVAMFLL